MACNTDAGTDSTAGTMQPPAIAPATEVPRLAPSDGGEIAVPGAGGTAGDREKEAKASATPDDRATVVSLSGSEGDASPGTGRRCGKWSAEEEAYTARLIECFDAGSLATCGAPASVSLLFGPRRARARGSSAAFLRRAEEGMTLRAFLSKKLNCSTMRISKKFAGKKCLGKQIYVRKVAAEGGDDDAALAALEKAFVDSAQNRPPPRAKRPAPKGPRREPSAKKARARRGRAESVIPESEIVALLSASSSSSGGDDSLSELSYSEDELGALLPLSEAKEAAPPATPSADVTRMISSWSYVLESFDLIHGPEDASANAIDLPDLADLPDLDSQVVTAAGAARPRGFSDFWSDPHAPEASAAAADPKGIYAISCPAC